MSSPLFIREPILGSNSAQIRLSGQDVLGVITWGDLVASADGEEPRLIEEILFSAEAYSTDAGQLLIAVGNPANIKTQVMAVAIPAGSATLFASLRVRVDIVLPVGWKICVAHNVMKSAAYVMLQFQPVGGIVR